MAPQPLRSSQESIRNVASSQLANAHLAEADALEYVRQQQLKIERLLREGTGEAPFHHRSNDDQDALFMVYYRSSNAVEVRAVELREINSRDPSARERMSHERALMREVREGGELWLELLAELP